jgi:hypothetical protein
MGEGSWKLNDACNRYDLENLQTSSVHLFTFSLFHLNTRNKLTI